MGGPAGRLATAPNKSGVLALAQVPRSLALRPSNPDPGTVPRIAPRCGLAVRTCPFGHDQCSPRRDAATTALSTNFVDITARLSPTFPPLWTACGEPLTSARCVDGVDSSTEVIDGSTAGAVPGAARGAERRLGEAVRRVQPALADGAVPTHPPDPGPAQWALARASTPCRLDRPADRPAPRQRHPRPRRSADGRRHHPDRDDRLDGPLSAVGPRRLQRYGRHRADPGDPARDAHDDRPDRARRIGPRPRRRPGRSNRCRSPCRSSGSSS